MRWNNKKQADSKLNPHEWTMHNDFELYNVHAEREKIPKPFKEELEWLQQQDILKPLCVDETAEWSNILVLVPKLNGKVRLCLDLVRLNQVLIWPVHRKPKLNNIFPKLNDVKYLSLIVGSSCYYNLNLDERLSYLTAFAIQFYRYRYKTLPFAVAPAGDMFQWKIDKIFKE